MKKITMTKYGFIRWPEEDFSDDGTRFTAFRVGERVRVTKATYKGEAYIDGTIHGTKLPYEVYSKLPHYSATGKLNGVSIESMTDQDLIDLYEACLAYEREYTEAEAAIQLPTLNEIRLQCLRVQDKARQELEEINKLTSVVLAIKLSDWEWRDFRKYLLAIEAKINSFNPDKYPQTIVGTSKSIDFCKPTCHELRDSWYYTWIMEKLSK